MLPPWIQYLPELTTVAGDMSLEEWAFRYLESGMAEHDWRERLLYQEAEFVKIGREQDAYRQAHGEQSHA